MSAIRRTAGTVRGAAASRKSNNKQSREPFGVAMLALMDAEDLTFREVAARMKSVDEEGRGIHHATLNMIVNGHDNPSKRVIVLAARVFGLDPMYFADYRLMEAQEAVDPAKVGFEQALTNLDARLAAKRPR